LGNDVPRHASTAAVRGHVIEYGAMGEGQVQHFSGVTALRVTPRHLSRLRRGGRARWKSAPETLKTLKTQGDHCDHPSGHGLQHLAVMLAMVMRLALVVDQTPPRCGALFQAVGAELGSKRRMGARLRALCDD
jgi:hypothetical protein